MATFGHARNVCPLLKEKPGFWANFEYLRD